MTIGIHLICLNQKGSAGSEGGLPSTKTRAREKEMEENVYWNVDGM